MATERIRITASLIKGMQDDHLQKHEDVYDPMLKKHDKTLYGPDGDDGIVYDVKEIINGFKNIKNIGYVVIATVIADIIIRLIYLPK